MFERVTFLRAAALDPLVRATPVSEGIRAFTALALEELSTLREVVDRREVACLSIAWDLRQNQCFVMSEKNQIECSGDFIRPSDPFASQNRLILRTFFGLE